MVPVSYRVTDSSQVKLHAQDDGICVSLREGEWVWLANRVAETLGTMLNIATNNELPDEDLEESDYEVSYKLPGSDELLTMTVKATSETDAMVQFYDNAPAEYKAKLSKIEITRKG